MKSSRFPLVYRVWIAASGAVFAAALGLQLFFSLTAYGFLYSEVPLWLCLGSFISLLVGLTIWLCRCVFKKAAGKILAAATGALLSLALAYVGSIFVVVTAIGVHRDVHTSPGGTNRFVAIYNDSYEEPFFAYPMRNRWIYKTVDNGSVWASYFGMDERENYTVEWPSESLAVVEVRNNKIVVDFERWK